MTTVGRTVRGPFEEVDMSGHNLLMVSWRTLEAILSA